MGAKAWSLRYLLQKIHLGVEETIGASSSNLTVALTKGIEAYRRVRMSALLLHSSADAVVCLLRPAHQSCTQPALRCCGAAAAAGADHRHVPDRRCHGAPLALPRTAFYLLIYMVLRHTDRAQGYGAERTEELGTVGGRARQLTHICTS